MTPHSQPDPPTREPYPGRLRIVPWPNLPDLERQMEGDLVATVQRKNADQLYNALDLTYHGLVIDTDLYRELLPAYRTDPFGHVTGTQRMNRTRYKAATNSPARAAASDRFQRECATARRIIIMAGGPASGKSLTLRSMIEHIDITSTIIFETILADPAAAERMVRAIATQGRQLIIVWIYMPFRTAVDGMLRRALDDGRFVTMENMVDLHRSSRATILRLINRCRDLPNLHISAIGNFGNREDQLPLDRLASLLDNPTDRISHDIALDQFHRSGLQYRFDPFLAKHLYEEYPAGIYDERPTRRAGEQAQHGSPQPPLP